MKSISSRNAKQHEKDAEAEQRDQKWIQKWRNQCYKCNGLSQHEVYIGEELDKLTNKDDEWKDTLRHPPNSTVQEPWPCKQAVPGILSKKQNAVVFINQWFWNQFYPQKSLRKEQCMVAGGCCERKCGCCYKPRQTKDGKTTKHYDELKQSYNNYAHCTEDCGCCLRSWESRWTN